MKPRIGVLLSGCGFLDGSEVHEAMLTLLHLDQQGAEAVCMAPNADQALVVDHARQQPASGARNMLSEAARIARGAIVEVAAVDAATLHGLILPGGFGAAKNLCNFASAGAQAQVRPEVARLLRELHAAQKPIGAICIAPALLALLFGKEQPRLTIGSDPDTARTLAACGALHQTCSVRDCVVDERLALVTTPAYMCDASVAEVAQGIGKLVEQVLLLARRQR